jgi:hypothetical protein
MESIVGGDDGGCLGVAARAGECGGERGESGAVVDTVEPGASTSVDIDVDEIEPAAAMLTRTPWRVGRRAAARLC